MNDVTGYLVGGFVKLAWPLELERSVQQIRPTWSTSHHCYETYLSLCQICHCRVDPVLAFSKARSSLDPATQSPQVLWQGTVCHSKCWKPEIELADGR